MGHKLVTVVDGWRFEVTLVWFVIWLIANNVGSTEALIFDPVNGWAATLILAAALDMSGHHARTG